MAELNAPIDGLHQACLIERDNIRRWVAVATYHVRHWQPAPCPPTTEREET